MVRSLTMASDDDRDTGGISGKLGDLTVQLVAAGTLALVATCIRVWSGVDVIQSQIATLTRSDSQQDERIEQIRSEINTMRVQIGVLREVERRR